MYSLDYQFLTIFDAFYISLFQLNKRDRNMINKIVSNISTSLILVNEYTASMYKLKRKYIPCTLCGVAYPYNGNKMHGLSKSMYVHVNILYNWFFLSAQQATLRAKGVNGIHSSCQFSSMHFIFVIHTQFGSYVLNCIQIYIFSANLYSPVLKSCIQYRSLFFI